MLTAYDDYGDPFWGFVQELVLINHWDDLNGTLPDKLFYETIPEAQELMRELLQRGLVYITRIHGYPPPTTGRFVVTEKEVEAIVADTQNWVGPIDEGPSAIYYCFCSTMPGVSITEDSLTSLSMSTSQSSD